MTSVFAVYESLRSGETAVQADTCPQPIRRSRRGSYLKLLLPIALLSAVPGVFAAVETGSAKPLTLEKALAVALENDPWLSGSLLEQQAMKAMAESAYQLPDPKFSLALANLPTDTFDFGQEAMTQLVVGVSQMYPRGDSLRLQRERLSLQSERQPFLRAEREAKLRLAVTQQWLNAYQARQSVKLITQDMALFDQLVDISRASYTSALGRTRQQDLIQAQLEQTRIQDRLTRLQQMQDVAEQTLLEWLLPPLSYSAEATLLSAGYSGDLPQLSTHFNGLLQGKPLTNSELTEYFIRHPRVRALDQSIAAAGSSVALAKQKYKPEWGITASYGYRGEDPSGRDRADLFSAGVTLSMPLFSTTAQDKEVEAAIAGQEKVRTDRSLMIRQMISAFHTARAQIERLDQRQQLYSEKLLPQVKRQAKAALNGYESDNGSFTEVVRARISELNTRIDYLEIRVERLKQIAQLNYVLTTVSPAMDNTALSYTGVTQ